MNQLKEVLLTVKTNLEKRAYPNEATVSLGLRLTQDIVFKSKAQATNVLEGYSQNANRAWYRKN